MPASRSLAILLLGLTMLCAASAQTVSGFGSRKCSDYLAAVSKEQKPAIDGYISWAQGFISAHNWLDPRRRDIAADPGGLTYWLVDECGRRPGQHFYEAMQAFIEAHAR